MIFAYKLIIMNTIQHPYTRVYDNTTTHISDVEKFFNWCKKQEEKRFLWLAIAVVGHGCFFTIITVASILLAGNSFILWPFAIAAMAMPLITNLAALPTKITIPVFFFSLFIDLVIIGICLVHGFDITTTYV